MTATPSPTTASQLLPYGQIVVHLLADCPPNTVVWRTMSGPVTAGQMRVGLLAQNEDFRRWVSDTLRVIRDVFAMRAELGEPAFCPSGAHRELARRALDTPFLGLLSELPDPEMPAFWTEESGPVSVEALQAALPLRTPVAIEYIASFIGEQANAFSFATPGAAR